MIYAATQWPTNAAMIKDVVALGYIKPTDVVLDVTYGRGLWWTQYCHDRGLFLGLVWTHDSQRRVIYNDPVMLVEDFRDIHIESDRADVVAFDPPYIAPGGRTTSTITDFNDRYGLYDAARTPAELHASNMAGLGECNRIAKPGGIILLKCMDYISSGAYHPIVYLTLKNAIEVLSMDLVDRFEHIGGGRPQPGGRRQVHARRNHSTLLILRTAR